MIFPTLSVPNCVPLPEDARLRSTYLWNRYSLAPRLVPACEALARTRARIANGGPEAYKFAPRHSRTAGPVARDGSRWIESPDGLGLREAGLASDLVRHLPCGYYMDSDGSGELARAAVFQWPARAGVCQFVPAVLDPWNAGPAMIWTAESYPDAQEAARAADGYAESYAEQAREYDDSWRAGVEARELAEQATRAARVWIIDERARRVANKEGVGSGIRAAVERVTRRTCAEFQEAREAAQEARRARVADSDGWRAGYHGL